MFVRVCVCVCECSCVCEYVCKMKENVKIPLCGIIVKISNCMKKWKSLAKDKNKKNVELLN